MGKPTYIELPSGDRIPIIYEDRSVLAIDKPEGWMLAPSSWQHTARNLQMALMSSIRARDFWARSRNLKFLRYVHRLDAETTGVLLLAKSPGAVATLGALFESRQMAKTYWAVVRGQPLRNHWECRLKIAPEPSQKGRMKVDNAHGKEAETHFRVLQAGGGRALVEARPLTGRTHQIRVHLAASGHPVVGDDLYGGLGQQDEALALRAVALGYIDPFTRRRVRIQAPSAEFGRNFGFSIMDERAGDPV